MPPVVASRLRATDVRHFAGDVAYSCANFLEKNNDSLAKEVDEHLLKSSKPIVPNICRPETPAELTGGKKGGAKKGQSSFSSVGDKFVKSLKSLMTELGAGQAHFIRCIKSNPDLQPKKLHGASVIEQLRMSGTLDAVRLIQAGFPTRIPYELIHTRYKDLLADALLARRGGAGGGAGGAGPSGSVAKQPRRAAESMLFVSCCYPCFAPMGSSSGSCSTRGGQPECLENQRLPDWLARTRTETRRLLVEPGSSAVAPRTHLGR